MMDIINQQDIIRLVSKGFDISSIPLLLARISKRYNQFNWNYSHVDQWHYFTANTDSPIRFFQYSFDENLNFTRAINSARIFYHSSLGSSATYIASVPDTNGVVARVPTRESCLYDFSQDWARINPLTPLGVFFVFPKDEYRLITNNQFACANLQSALCNDIETMLEVIHELDTKLGATLMFYFFVLSRAHASEDIVHAMIEVLRTMPSLVRHWPPIYLDVMARWQVNRFYLTNQPQLARKAIRAG